MYENEMPNINIVNHFAPLTAFLRDFVHEFNKEWDVTLSSDFMCCIDTCVITYAIALGGKMEESFRAHFLSRFPACECLSTFMLSFLHELGHEETEWDMDDDVALRNAPDMDCEKYYHLHNEWIATQWAGEWAIENLERAKELDTKFTQIATALINQICD